MKRALFLIFIQVSIFSLTGSVQAQNNELVYPHKGIIFPCTIMNRVNFDSLSWCEKIDFIKIDVEGSEWAVLRGAQRILQQYQPALMVELNDETASLAGYTVDQMILWLDSLGYKPFLIDKSGLIPMSHRPAFCNAIFLIG